MTFTQGISDLSPMQELAKLRRVVASMNKEREELLSALDCIRAEIGSNYQTETPTGTLETCHYIARKAIEKANA